MRRLHTFRRCRRRVPRRRGADGDARRRHAAAFTGLAAAVAFRMGVFNIGGEGQFYVGAIARRGVGLCSARAAGEAVIPVMIVAGAAGGARGARSRASCGRSLSTNEIITSLMLNYVAALRPQLPDLQQPLDWRDTSDPRRAVPAGQAAARRGGLADASRRGLGRPARLRARDLCVASRLGALRANALRLRGQGDRRLAARRALRRDAHAAQDGRGDGPVRARSPESAAQPGRRRSPRARSARALSQAGYGYAGIVVAALARFNPIAVVFVSRVDRRAAQRRLRCRAPTSRPVSSARCRG